MAKLLLIAVAYIGILVGFRKLGGFQAAGQAMQDWAKRIGVR
jgi:hypothetical protein